MNKTYIIAEIGLNHCVSNDPVNYRKEFLDNAKKLIDIAAAAGCNAVKFQKRNPDLCVPEEQKNKEKVVPWRGKPTTYLQYKKDIEFDTKEYMEIDNYCAEKNIGWSASPWDLDSLMFLKNIKDSSKNKRTCLPFIKIASASITDMVLLKNVKSYFDNVIISTGMSTEEEIEKAVEVFTDTFTNLGILHCNSSYPAHVSDLNLSYIKNLKEKYPWANIGYSGHEFGLNTSIAAVYLGAEIIERHITLSRDLWGSDQMASVEPQGFFKLVKSIRDLESAYGDGVKVVTEDEDKKRKSLRKV